MTDQLKWDEEGSALELVAKLFDFIMSILTIYAP